MNAIKVNVIVAQDGQFRLEVQAPPGITPGIYQGMLVLEEQLVAEEQKRGRPPLKFMPVSIYRWPEALSLRREDMYGDDGR